MLLRFVQKWVRSLFIPKRRWSTLSEQTFFARFPSSRVWVEPRISHVDRESKQMSPSRIVDAIRACFATTAKWLEGTSQILIRATEGLGAENKDWRYVTWNKHLLTDLRIRVMKSWPMISRCILSMMHWPLSSKCGIYIVDNLLPTSGHRHVPWTSVSFSYCPHNLNWMKWRSTKYGRYHSALLLIQVWLKVWGIHWLL